MEKKESPQGLIIIFRKLQRCVSGGNVHLAHHYVTYFARRINNFHLYFTNL